MGFGDVGGGVRKEGLRLTWSRTWPDRPRDFRCQTPEGGSVGRIYFSGGGDVVASGWRWFVNGAYRDRLLSHSGVEKDKASAARALEAAWFAAVERIDQLVAGCPFLNPAVRLAQASTKSTG